MRSSKHKSGLCSLQRCAAMLICRCSQPQLGSPLSSSSLAWEHVIELLVGWVLLICTWRIPTRHGQLKGKCCPTALPRATLNSFSSISCPWPSALWKWPCFSSSSTAALERGREVGQDHCAADQASTCHGMFKKTKWWSTATHRFVIRWRRRGAKKTNWFYLIIYIERERVFCSWLMLETLRVTGRHPNFP